MNKTEKKYYLHYLGFTSKGFVPKVSTPYSTKKEALKNQKSMIKSLKIKSIIDNNKLKETMKKVGYSNSVIRTVKPTKISKVVISESKKTMRFDSLK
jgi:hypothetical protein